MDKKGFLFTVTVFLVLMYILLTISVWVKAVETSERAYGEFYKESTVELSIEQITPAKMRNVSSIIMNREISRLTDIAIDNPVIAGTDDENENLRAAMNELFVNGSANSSYFRGDPGSMTAEEPTSINAWASNLNASLLAIGVYISDLRVSNFSIGQSDISHVNYSFDLWLQMKDYSNTSSVSRNYHINDSVDITGFVDPALARETEAHGETVYRQFFFHDYYDSTSSISVDRLQQEVEGGQGWIYGSLAVVHDGTDAAPEWSDIPPSKRPTYIIVGNYSEIRSFQTSQRNAFDDFIGFIITSEPTETSTDCGTEEDDTYNPIRYDDDCEPGIGNPTLSKPYIIAPGFDANNAPDCPLLGSNYSMGKCVLFINSHLEGEIPSDPLLKRDTDGAGLFDVETVRDYIMCGYYTHNPDAPSFLQRLLEDSYSRTSPEYGIETFVIGNYADYNDYDLNSRIDRELTNDTIEGIRIRGMPGCKNLASCSDNPVTGVFAVSDPSDYDLDSIACDNDAAGCDR